MGVKIREAKPITKLATEPATEPTTEPATEPATKPMNEAWAVYKKRKRDNWASTAEEKEEEEKYEQFLADFMDQNGGRLPDLQRGEDSYMTDFKEFLPGVRRFWKRLCN
jgi:hypothetical protein